MKIDKLDVQILRHLIKDARKPYTEIAKELVVSSGTIHVRLKKMEQMGIITGTSLHVDYEKLGYTFIAHIGIYLTRTSLALDVIEELRKIPEVTVAHLTTGRFSLFVKIRCKDTPHAKEVIYQINDIEGVTQTETMISLEECINSNQRLLEAIFDESAY
ncbi:MAG: Lrp/AsnC ligand binding domain-containing protein [Bacteroidota bacterium]|mgnify:FL=1|nr:Lrp/AsnC ligand binding domain-containing protein [Bacteroidota bacterium]